MNGDSRDIDYFGDPLLCSLSNLPHLSYVTGTCILLSPPKAATSFEKRINMWCENSILNGKFYECSGTVVTEGFHGHDGPETR